MEQSELRERDAARRYSPLEWLVGGLMLVLVLVVFAQVVFRYVTYQPLAWTDEIARLLFIWTSLLGAAVGSLRGAHFGIDLISRRISGLAGRLLRCTLRVVEAGFYVCLAWGGVAVTMVVHDERSATLGFQMSLAYGVIPLAAALMCVFTLRRAARELRRK